MDTEISKIRPIWSSQASPPLIDHKSLEKLYPNHLELKQLIVILRHGERAPHSPKSLELLSANWDFCKKSAPSFSRVQVSEERLLYIQTTQAQTLEIAPNSILQAMKCIDGQLTDVGRETIERNGRHLRSIYTNHLQFLSDKFEEDEFHLRTTDCPRTVESLQHLLIGLYPNLHKNTTPLKFISRIGTHDNILIDFKCNRIPVLRKEYSSPRLLQDWESLRSKLIKNTSLDAVLSNPEYKQTSAIRHIHDTLSCAFAHKVQLPYGLTSEHMKNLDLLQVELRLGAFLRSKELTRIGIGRLFSELSAQFSSVVNHVPASPKMAVYSGHDITLGSFLIGLDAFDLKWPAFGSMVMLELFKDRKVAQSDISSHYVRVKYDDKILDLPQCQASGQHHPELGTTFCNLATIFHLFQKNIPLNYLKECCGFASENKFF